jgi:hypothetical protein
VVGPAVGYFVGEGLSGVTATVEAVGIAKISIAEGADGLGAVFLAATPEITAGKTAEHSGPPALSPFALQGVEDFFDFVGGHLEKNAFLRGLFA